VGVPSSEAPRGTSAPGAGGCALWNLGFRPFFLLAGLFAAISVPWWMAQLAGWAGARAYGGGPYWHAHGMIFGFAFAVVVGFLFTAVRNWTNQPTPTGPALMAIAALWLAGRVLVETPWAALAAATDAAFALAAAAGIAVPLWRSRNRRNYFFVALIAALGGAGVAVHLALAGAAAFAAGRSLAIALDLVLLIMAVMGGRVIPMFTANAVPGASPARLPWLERTALGSVAALIAVDLAGAPAPAIALLAAVAAIAHAARLALWRPWRTAGRPILWILHASYAWIAVHLALRAFAALELIPPGLATHALTVGAIGGLTLGMMTRVARGHTGRPLQAGAAEALAYVLIQLAAVARVFGPLVVPRWYLDAVVVSGLLWSAAFALFTVACWPMLVQPRIDGRDG
jgi:uncharacterized protein involved in response to NO